MRRREFIALLGGAAAAWPLAARAQQGERMRRIGVLLPAATDDSEFQARLAAFQLELQRSGWIIGSNMRIDIRWGGGNADRIRKYAAELVVWDVRRYRRHRRGPLHNVELDSTGWK
jgi:putative ABC transport system substrate-binding protein